MPVGQLPFRKPLRLRQLRYFFGAEGFGVGGTSFVGAGGFVGVFGALKAPS